MLVLNRKKDEKVMIGHDIEITVVDIIGHKIRLGITAPKEIPVHREEVYLEIYGHKSGPSQQLPHETLHTDA